MAWDNDDDMAKMLAALRSHNYQALVLDSPVVQYFAAQAEQCDLFPVGECRARGCSNFCFSRHTHIHAFTTLGQSNAAALHRFAVRMPPT